MMLTFSNNLSTQEIITGTPDPNFQNFHRIDQDTFWYHVQKLAYVFIAAFTIFVVCRIIKPVD